MDNIWWERVPNALRLISSFVDCLEKEKSIVFVHHDNLPWPDIFYEQVESLIRQNISGYGLDYLIDSESEEPGYQIFTKYCKKELRDDYRPAIGYAKFLAGARSIILNTSIVWIKSDSEQRTKQWCDFIAQYRTKLATDVSGALFIVETNMDYSDSVSKGIKLIKYNDYIGQFDSYIFSILASSIISVSHDVKEYLAETVTSIIESDIELSSYCLSEKYYKIFLQDPYSCIGNIVRNEVRSDGNVFSEELSANKIENGLWKAQIKYLFPQIESFRERFITKNYDLIQSALPISNTSGEIYENAKDVEIGTLYYMACNGLLDIKRDKIDELKKYKEARNKLAHLEVLPYEDIKTLIV